MSTRFLSNVRVFLILASIVTVVLACTQQEPEPPRETADEWAQFAVGATGSSETWGSMPFFGFTFSIERDGQIVSDRKHMWNRNSGDYRIEWSGGTDSVYVVLFNTGSKEGTAFLNGQALPESEAGSYIESGYARYINDTYWLLMPKKLMDAGVSRKLVADSSDTESVVVGLSFDTVGLTPGDRYWVRIDRQTGDVLAWSYILERNTTGMSTTYDWDE